MIRKTFEYRLRPTAAQKRRLVSTLDACRSTYNWALEDRILLWQYAKCGTSFYDQSSYLKILKRERAWLTCAHAHALSDAVRRVDIAFAGFFRRVATKRTPGHPRFRSRDRYDSFTMKEWGNGVRLDGNRLILTKIGRVRIVLHRPLLGKAKYCTVRRRADGWYALVAVECDDATPRLAIAPIGVDMGLRTFATLSNGEFISTPRNALTSASELAKRQRILSKRARGSRRRMKARHAVARWHLSVARARKDFHFKAARSIATRFSPIVVEQLAISQMAKHPTLAKPIYDAAWGQFLRILSHSAESAGAAYMAVEARGTSQICSTCGAMVPKTLSDRTHRCTSCGLVLDRDVNAARVILQRGWASPSAKALGAPHDPRKVPTYLPVGDATYYARGS